MNADRLDVGGAANAAMANGMVPPYIVGFDDPAADDNPPPHIMAIARQTARLFASVAESCACVFLAGPDADGRYGYLAYEHRPIVCQDFDCREQPPTRREVKGERQWRSLPGMRATVRGHLVERWDWPAGVLPDVRSRDGLQASRRRGRTRLTKRHRAKPGLRIRPGGFAWREAKCQT
jgi:hypothetical protein